MNKTPFDKIAVALIENPNFLFKPSSLPCKPSDFSKNRNLLLAFIGTLRIKYLHMQEASEIYWNLHSKMMTPHENKTRTVSTEEIAHSNHQSLQAKINYFSFIEELNRYGRMFEDKHQKTIPDFYRIRFFRNKMVEHWDDYLEFVLYGDGIRFAVNKLVVPYHCGVSGPTILEIPNLKKEFQKYNINGVQLSEYALDPNNCNNIYAALENKYPKLEKIPENLLKAIFRYGFPTPIHDLEEYIERLIKWIESL